MAERDDLRSNGGVCLHEIGDVDSRRSLRIGELMNLAIRQDPIFCRELILAKKIRVEEFLNFDGGVLGVMQEVISRRIEDVGGKGAVIRVLGIALKNLKDLDELNGDKEAIREEMMLMQNKLRQEVRLAKRLAKRNAFIAPSHCYPSF